MSPYSAGSPVNARCCTAPSLAHVFVCRDRRSAATSPLLLVARVGADLRYVEAFPVGSERGGDVV